jgi:hypothetical protein
MSFHVLLLMTRIVVGLVGHLPQLIGNDRGHMQMDSLLYSVAVAHFLFPYPLYVHCHGGFTYWQSPIETGYPHFSPYFLRG